MLEGQRILAVETLALSPAGPAISKALTIFRLTFGLGTLTLDLPLGLRFFRIDGEEFVDSALI